jgi:SAM-dependent methyltransferase
MAKSELIARQSRRPSGWLGEIVGRVMAFDTAHANRVAVERLGLRETESALEIGCGHGRTLAGLARSSRGFVAGIDPSEVMVRLARRRLRRDIAAGRAEVSLASSAEIPHPDQRFDAALAVHVVYFWDDPVADLREILRVLRPGGRLLLGYRPRDADTVAALPATVYALRTANDVECLLEQAGFTQIRSLECSSGSRPLTCTLAQVPTTPTARVDTSGCGRPA